MTSSNAERREPGERLQGSNPESHFQTSVLPLVLPSVYRFESRSRKIANGLHLRYLSESKR